ncbi:PadR family transcriptional regulator [Pseudonocardiaceae bacterium YIM PH 21723]|nr:PadR family transcriptional regulator [Pseudonocardiaceae bacterium YIM PH 21723]
MAAKHRRSPVALTVLALLHSRPLHPYGVQALIKLWGKDQVINVTQRATLYKAFKRLADAGLIAVRQTEREHQYPERTVYRLTEDGRRVLDEWLAETIIGEHNEYPEFPVGLSFIMLLTPESALPLLEQRVTRLQTRFDQVDAELRVAQAPGPDRLPPVAVVESDYLRAMLRAELDWLAGFIGDLRDGRMSWREEELRAFAESHTPEL